MFLGVGTHQSMRGGLDNEDAPGADALPFLIANTKQIMGFAETADEPYVSMEGKRGGARRWRYRDGLRTHLRPSECGARDLRLSP